MKKLLLLFFLFPFMCSCNADFFEKNEINKIEKKYNLKYWMPNYNYKIINDNSSDQSYSILKNGCNIEININKNNPILMKTKTKDIEFTFLHEIGHCILGNDALVKNINWIINIKEEERKKINNLIIENEQFYLKNPQTALIKVIYHEIFADTFATLLYLKRNPNNENDIQYLLEKRIEQNKNPYDTHLSANSIEYILKNKNVLKNLTIEKLKDKSIEITQKQLLNYIRVEYE